MKLRELIAIGVSIIAISVAIWGHYHPRVEVYPSPVITLPQKTVYRLKDCTVIPPDGGTPATGPTVTLATATVPKSPEGGTLVTSLTLSTGEVRNDFTPKPRPLMAFEDEKRIKFITNGTGGILSAGWTFARIGDIYLSADTFAWSIYGESGFYAGIGVEYKW